MQIFGKGLGEELNGLSFIIDESLNCSVKYKICLQFCKEITAAGLAQLERLTEEREGHGFASRGRTNAKGLKRTEK